MAAYVDYQYYSTEYNGSAIAQAAFAGYAVKASAVIDQITFGRAGAVINADEDTDTIESIKMATCAVAEELQAQEAAGKMDNVTSERVGNYSVTYGEGAHALMTNVQKQAQAANVFLSNTGLMYRGFYGGEYAD